MDETVIVFDPTLWKGKDIGDNSQFWKSASIIRTYYKDGDKLVDVRFHYNNRISKGHFMSAIRFQWYIVQGER